MSYRNEPPPDYGTIALAIAALLLILAAAMLNSGGVP